MLLLVISVFENRMYVKIPYTNNWCSVLIIPLTNVHDYCFLSQYPHFNAEGVAAATQIVTSNFPCFLTSFNGKYNLVITDVRAVKESLFRCS